MQFYSDTADSNGLQDKIQLSIICIAMEWDIVLFNDLAQMSK